MAHVFSAETFDPINRHELVRYDLFKSMRSALVYARQMCQEWADEYNRVERKAELNGAIAVVEELFLTPMYRKFVVRVGKESWDEIYVRKMKVTE